MPRPRSSRQRYRGFVQDYRQRRLDEIADAQKHGTPAPDPATPDGDAPPAPEQKSWRQGKRRQYLREYLRWLWPHRFAVALVFVLALTAAGLQMIEPLFMRFIIDRVLLNTALDTAVAAQPPPPGRRALRRPDRRCRNLISVLKDYRQRLLNTRVMLSLRRSLFERLLHLPLPKLWDMKTGGILSRLTGDVDTTTGPAADGDRVAGASRSSGWSSPSACC